MWRDNDNWKYRTGYGHYSPGSKISEINWSKIIYFLVGPLETGNFWSGPGTFYTFLYKWMFEFLKILIRTGNFFSLVMNTAHDWCFYSLESLRCIPRIQVVADGSLSIFNGYMTLNTVILESQQPGAMMSWHNDYCGEFLWLSGYWEFWALVKP